MQVRVQRSLLCDHATFKENTPQVFLNGMVMRNVKLQKRFQSVGNKNKRKEKCKPYMASCFKLQISFSTYIYPECVTQLHRLVLMYLNIFKKEIVGKSTYRFYDLFSSDTKQSVTRDEQICSNHSNEENCNYVIINLQQKEKLKVLKSDRMTI